MRSHLPLHIALLCALPLALGAAAQAQAPAASARPPASTAPAAAKPAGPNLQNLPPVSGEALAHTCAACHGTFGRLGDEAFMPLAGLPVDQFVKTMQDFRSGQRPATLMGHVSRGLTDADLKGMAEYFARQKPAVGSLAAFDPSRRGDKP